MDATTQHHEPKHVRVEDNVLLRGRGSYIADAPLPTPGANSSTRLFALSATNKSPFGPTATPPGALNEEAVTAADVEVLKSV